MQEATGNHPTLWRALGGIATACLRFDASGKSMRVSSVAEDTVNPGTPGSTAFRRSVRPRAVRWLGASRSSTRERLEDVHLVAL